MERSKQRSQVAIFTVLDTFMSLDVSLDEKIIK